MAGFVHSGTLFFKFLLVVYMQALVYMFLSQLWMALCPSQISSNIINGLFSRCSSCLFYLSKRALCPVDGSVSNQPHPDNVPHTDMSRSPYHVAYQCVAVLVLCCWLQDFTTCYVHVLV